MLACCLALIVVSGADRAVARIPARPARAAAGSALGGLFELEEDQFTIHGSHGYLITVVGFLSPRQSVTLYAERGRSSVEYTVRGTVTEEELDANFGALGSIAVHFEPTGQTSEAIEYCDSTHPTVSVKTGAFVGTIDFHGERGYTSVNATRAEGGVGNSHALPGNRENAECQSTAAGGEVVRKAEFSILEATSKREHLYFSAIATTSVEGPPDPLISTSRVLLGAGSFTKEKHLEISRSVVIGAPASDFVFDSSLDSAIVEPPTPFAGKASLQTGPEGKSSWTGTLTAPIPGLGTVHLAGPSFHARINKSTGSIIH
jgi:hypothetical protein